MSHKVCKVAFAHRKDEVRGRVNTLPLKRKKAGQVLVGFLSTHTNIESDQEKASESTKAAGEVLGAVIMNNRRDQTLFLSNSNGELRAGVITQGGRGKKEVLVHLSGVSTEFLEKMRPHIGEYSPPYAAHYKKAA